MNISISVLKSFLDAQWIEISGFESYKYAKLGETIRDHPLDWTACR